jgi:hypothetical protein
VKRVYVVVRVLVVESVLWLVNGNWREEGRVVWEFGEEQEVIVRGVSRLVCSSIETMAKDRSVLRLLSTGIVAHLIMGGARLKLKRGVDLAAGTPSNEEQDGSTARDLGYFAKGLGNIQTARTVSITAQ